MIELVEAPVLVDGQAALPRLVDLSAGDELFRDPVVALTVADAVVDQAVWLEVEDEFGTGIPGHQRPCARVELGRIETGRQLGIFGARDAELLLQMEVALGALAVPLAARHGVDAKMDKHAEPRVGEPLQAGFKHRRSRGCHDRFADGQKGDEETECDGFDHEICYEVDPMLGKAVEICGIPFPSD